MVEPIDEARIIAWIDGELEAGEAAKTAAAVAGDPALAALADRHRAMKARFAAAFAPLADAPVEVPRSAPVISLAAVRAKREAAKAPVRDRQRRWAIPIGLAASLLAGLLIGHQLPFGAAIGDRPDALALGGPIAGALDRQLSGEGGNVRVALSFRDHGGALCRSFTATHLSGVACRENGGWHLRYGAGGSGATDGYRMAGGNAELMTAVGTMIAGDPLDHDGEVQARDRGWGKQ